MRKWGGALALAIIAFGSPAAAAEPTVEQAEAAAAASFSSRRFAQAGREYEELFARTRRPEHLLAAARAYAAIRTPEARDYAVAIAQRYRELPGSDPAAIDEALAPGQPAATPPAAPPPQSSPAPAPPLPRPPSMTFGGDDRIPRGQASDGDDSDMRVRLSADVGAFIAFEIKGFSHEIAGGFTGRFTWPIAKGAELGLRQTIHVTSIPYDRSDGSAGFGTSRDDATGSTNGASFLPTTCLTLILAPGSTVEFNASAGVGHFTSPELEELAPVFLVMPFSLVGALGFDAGLPRDKPGGWIRFGAEIDVAYAWTGPILLPRAAITARF